MAYTVPTKLPKYDVLRQRAQQASMAQEQDQDDAMKRRFASLGGLNSGAYFKQQQIAADQAMQRRGERLQDVDLAEQDEIQRLQELERGREFQREERLGSQDFGASQAELQRKYGTSERLGSQDFGASQAELQRKYGTSERLGGQEFQSAEAQKQRDLQDTQFGRQLGLEQSKYELAQDASDREQVSELFNAGLAFAQQADSKDIMSWMQRAEELYGRLIEQQRSARGRANPIIPIAWSRPNTPSYGGQNAGDVIRNPELPTGNGVRPYYWQGR